MKFLKLILKNLLRNKRRTFLTISSIAVSLFLVATLYTLLEQISNPPETPDSALRLITRHRISLLNILPVAHKEKIEAIEGVEEVAGSMWFGGYYRDPANFFANFSVDAAEHLAVHPDLEVPEEQKRAFVQDRTGALVGDNLAQRFGWEVGDKITLQGTLFSVDPELTIRAIYSGGPDNGTSLFFHWEYFNELMGDPSFVGTFTIRARSREDIPVIIERVDEMFTNSAAPTKTETERAFLLGFVEMMGDVQFFIASIVAVVIFTVILVAANSMAMSIRERTREVGIYKSLGFTRNHVLMLILGESVLLTSLGAFLGVFFGRLLFGVIDMATLTGGFIAQFQIQWTTILWAVLIGALVGLLSAGFPAWRSSNRSVVDALRRT